MIAFIADQDAMDDAVAPNGDDHAIDALELGAYGRSAARVVRPRRSLFTVRR
jgi:hypothetical protein